MGSSSPVSGGLELEVAWTFPSKPLAVASPASSRSTHSWCFGLFGRPTILASLSARSETVYRLSLKRVLGRTGRADGCWPIRREISSRREIGPRTDFSPSCVLRSALRISGCCPPTVTKSHSQPLSPNTATSSPSFLQTGSFSPTRRTTTDVTMCTSFPFGPRAQGAEFRPMVAERHDGEAMGRSSSIRALTER